MDDLCTHPSVHYFYRKNDSKVLSRLLRGTHYENIFMRISTNYPLFIEGQRILDSAFIRMVSASEAMRNNMFLLCFIC